MSVKLVIEDKLQSIKNHSPVGIDPMSYPLFRRETCHYTATGDDPRISCAAILTGATLRANCELVLELDLAVLVQTFVIGIPSPSNYPCPCL